jgi:hypothetical protein
MAPYAKKRARYDVTSHDHRDGGYPGGRRLD